MKLFKLTVLLSLIVVATSCDPAAKYKAEIDEIDSCIAVIEEMEGRLEGIKFDSLVIMVDHVVLNEARVKMYYKPDTLDMAFGMLLNECKGIRKSMSNLKGKHMLYSDEMNAVKNQFKDLKEDILNGIFDEEQIKGYLEKEKKDLKLVQINFNTFDSLQIKQSRIYYSSVPKVDEYITNLIAQSDTLPQ